MTDNTNLVAQCQDVASEAEALGDILPSLTGGASS